MIKSDEHSSNQGNHVGFLLFIILGALGAITPLAIDMYLPAMPSIANDLGVSAGAVQMTLTSYTAGFAIGQLLHGPLSDSFGRRPLMLVGLILFALGSYFCTSITDINGLAIIRAAQGFAGAAVAVVIQAVVRDMFDREDFARAMSFVTLVITLAPLLAPMMGGHLAVGAVVASMPGGVSWPMVMSMAACSVLSATCYWVFGRHA
ncbi:MFS transporter [Vibrio sp.]|nr:MFS transporter [Vibrio sp.]